MNCEKYLNLIDDFIDGELDELSGGEVDRHVFVCPSCAAHYEMLKRENEIYAWYLFNIEPPLDLRAKFQARLDGEKVQSARTVKSAGAYGWKSKIESFRKFYPALATAAFLIVAGIGFVKLTPVEKSAENERAAETNSSASPKFTKVAKIKELENDETDNAYKEITNGELKNSFKEIKRENAAGSLKINKIVEKSNPANGGKIIAANAKVYSIKTADVKPKTNFADNKTKFANDKKDSALIAEQERMRILQAQNLETETAAQIEKIELLLRSFRNARVVEGAPGFDVAYEKGQARKLLEINARLRQDAENYGISYAGELLSRAEPYLLDIANLENNPAPEKVLDIKERVKNQNIIASLQIY